MKISETIDEFVSTFALTIARSVSFFALTIALFYCLATLSCIPKNGQLIL